MHQFFKTAKDSVADFFAVEIDLLADVVKNREAVAKHAAMGAGWFVAVALGKIIAEDHGVELPSLPSSVSNAVILLSAGAFFLYTHLRAAPAQPAENNAIPAPGLRR